MLFFFSFFYSRGKVCVKNLGFLKLYWWSSPRLMITCYLIFFEIDTWLFNLKRRTKIGYLYSYGIIWLDMFSYDLTYLKQIFSFLLKKTVYVVVMMESSFTAVVMTS